MLTVSQLSVAVDDVSFVPSIWLNGIQLSQTYEQTEWTFEELQQTNQVPVVIGQKIRAIIS